MRILLLTAFLIIITGCTKPRLYPICFYNVQPSREVIEKEYIPKLEEALLAVLDDDREICMAHTPDARWFVVRTTDRENLTLSKIWPRIGCIGIASDAKTVHQESDCAEYVEDMIVNGNYISFGTFSGVAGPMMNEAANPKLLVYCDGTFARAK